MAATASGEWQGGSSWQSLARGAGSIEAEYLNGEIALLGGLHGVPTPVNELLERLALQAASKGTPPGSMRLEDLSEIAGMPSEG
jgi:2-dehydropantoate 2-reductase